MKTLAATLAFLALLTWSVTCRAGLIDGAGAADDGDGAVHCTGAAWDFGSQTMSLTGTQQWGPGHIGTEGLDNTAYFHAQSEEDPTITLLTSIDNDTTFAWTGYDVNVYMNKPFTLSLPTVSYDAWTVAGLGSYPVTATPIGGGKYQASVSFVGGSPLPIGDTLDFGYKLTFIGSVNYCQEMTPVPEPASLVLLVSGLMGVLVVRRKLVK
jgi:hypothetical protein